MDNLLAIAYPAAMTAHLAADALFHLHAERALVLADLVVAERAADGSLQLHQIFTPSGTAAHAGIGDALMTRIAGPVQAGGGAVFALLHSASAAKVLPRITPFGGEVLQTSLDDEREERWVHDVLRPVAMAA